MKKTVIFILIMNGMMLAGCQSQTGQDETGLCKLTLTFENKVGNQSLTLNTATYQNSLGQPYGVTAFKYYISQITLHNSNTMILTPIKDVFCLVTEGGKTLTLSNIPKGEYTDIYLHIGVDGDYNHRLDAIGDLDPTNDMAWTWNTGYKFVLLEGTSSASPNNALVFHIGGDDNFKSTDFKFPAPLVLTPNKTPVLAFQADVNALFGSPNPVDFASTHNVMGGDPAAKIAANYAAALLSLKSVNP